MEDSNPIVQKGSNSVRRAEEKYYGTKHCNPTSLNVYRLVGHLVHDHRPFGYRHCHALQIDVACNLQDWLQEVQLERVHVDLH